MLSRLGIVTVTPDPAVTSTERSRTSAPAGRASAHTRLHPGRLRPRRPRHARRRDRPSAAAANGSRARGPCNRSWLPVASPGDKQRGELRDDADPAALASAMLGAIQGGLLLTQIRRSSAPSGRQPRPSSATSKPPPASGDLLAQVAVVLQRGRTPREQDLLA